MKVLLDTCVISEVRRSNADPAVRAQVQAVPAEDVYLSVVTIGEIQRGIELLPEGQQRVALEEWIRTIEHHHAERILSIDIEVARCWGQLDARARRSGVTVPVADGLIAATALRHDLVILTRNTVHFQATGARVHDPWA